MKTPSVLRIAVLGLLLTAGISIAAAQTYTVEDPRPLWKCITLLESKYGWRVTYEDPPYENAADLVDITHPAVKAAEPSAMTFIPKTKTFSFRFYGPAGEEPDRRTVLDSMVGTYTQSGNIGSFRVLHQGDLSHVIAAEWKKRDGKVEKRRSLFDTLISFPAQERSIGEALALILELAGNQAGTQIVLGNVSGNLLTHGTQIGAQGITARDALVLLFGGLDAEAIGYGLGPIRVTWALLYQADQKTYYFNAHGVALQEQKTILGTKPQ